jgi:hypothetical protein
MKYSKRIVEQICELIRADSYTITEICDMARISKETYYTWLKEKSDFSDAIKKAKDDFKEDMLIECERSLVKLIKGYTIQEKKVISIDSGKKDELGRSIPKIKEQTIVDKHIQPSLGAIIHYQTNADPEHWRNKQSMELTGKGGKDLIPPTYVIGDDKFIEEFNKKLEAENEQTNEHSANKT